MTGLLVTADDFGSGSGRNAGIAAAFTRGIVTGATVLANGPAVDEALRLARELDLPVGVHLNLSEGQALNGPIAGLTDAAGAFPGKAGLRAILTGSTFDTTAAARELSAQIARVRDAGLTPTHLDSHQHFALFAGATPLFIAAAHAAGIAAVRLPQPAEASQLDPCGALGTELALYRRLAPACAAALQRAGLRTPQGLYGMPLLNRLDEAALRAVISALPAGCWELLTHPGYPDPDDPFGGPERSRETAALTAPAVRTAIANHQIRLLSFRDIACAS